jgi:hypothetical protein
MSAFATIAATSCSPSAAHPEQSLQRLLIHLFTFRTFNVLIVAILHIVYPRTWSTPIVKEMIIASDAFEIIALLKRLPMISLVTVAYRKVPKVRQASSKAVVHLVPAETDFNQVR